MIRVAGLFLYPVKSLRGFPVAAAQVDALGFAGDRRFLVVDETGRFLTQRTVPRMALVATGLSDGLLHFSAEGAGSLVVQAAPDPAVPLLSVSVWSHTGLRAEDCGDEPAAWLGEILGTSCRLVRIGPAFRRPVTMEHARQGDLFSFADGAPLLVTTKASLDELNRRIQENGGDPVPVDRFRPNLVLEGCAPFAEDEWTGIQIAGVRFRTAGACERCIVTTADQLTGQRGKEPLKTLASFRRAPLDAKSVTFGVNLLQTDKIGLVKVGDLVETATAIS